MSYLRPRKNVLRCDYCGAKLHPFDNRTHPKMPGLAFCDEPCMMYALVERFPEEGKPHSPRKDGNHEEAKGSNNDG